MHVHFLGEADDGRSISSHHAQILAALGAEISFSPADRLDPITSRGTDVAHLVTRGPIDPALLRSVLRLRGAGKPVVRVWTGEDILWAKWHAPARAAAESLARTGVRQLCRSQKEIDLLAELDLGADLLPIVSTNISVRSQPQPLPQQLTLLAHLPADKREFYGGELINSLARWMPSVRFLVLTDQPRASETKNLEYLTGVADPGRSIQRATAVLHSRLDQSVSRLVPEALSHGRQVITGCRFPDTLHAQSIDDYVNAIRTLQREASFNLAGREAVGKLYDRRVAGEALLQTLRQTMDEENWSGGIRSGLVRAANLVREPLAESPALPDPESLPAEALPFRALLRDRLAAAERASIPIPAQP